MAGLFSTAARYRENWAGATVVLSPGPVPTTDYYLTPRLSGPASGPVFRFDSRCFDPSAEGLPKGAFVMIVRHANGRWLRFLDRNRERWSGVAYLIDDDIPGALHCDDVPFDYALWTTGRYLAARGGLARVCDRVWMSTAALRARYAGNASTLVEPLAFGPARNAAPPGCRRWCYHGTRIHGRELRWLVPVVNAVQRAMPDAEFEVFGGNRVARLFRGIPRVVVLPPRPWPEYVTHCLASDSAVGVAPMLPGGFNAVRSHTKIFDVARCGAVGVFSAREPYVSRLAETGAALLPDAPEAWVNEVLRLLQNDALRLERYRSTAAWIETRCRQGGIADLIAPMRMGASQGSAFPR